MRAGRSFEPMHKAGKLAGPAFTVKTAPGDNLLVHKALDSARPGDVIVVDAGGFGDHAIIGELMMSRARQRGVAGIVIWGAIRDSAEIGAGDYPVYACAVTHRGPYKNGPGEINVPISIAGMPVAPGRHHRGRRRRADSGAAGAGRAGARLRQGDPREGNRGHARHPRRHGRPRLGRQGAARKRLQVLRLVGAVAGGWRR